MSLVVSDTSPIRALHHLRLLELLQRLYGTVVVPPAVASELARPPAEFTPIDLRKLQFAIIRAPSDVQRVQELRDVLDAGEAEAIALAIELNKATILIDEAAGRAVAAASGIPHIGVLGILARAKNERFIGPIRPLLNKLRTELKFRVSDQLYATYLQSVGEGP